MDQIPFTFLWRGKERKATYSKEIEGLSVTVINEEFKELYLTKMTFPRDDVERTYDRLHSVSPDLEQVYQIIYDEVLKSAGHPVYMERP